MNKINVGIVFGGVSSEHEISLLSAYTVLSNIDKEKYNVYKIGISKQGEMFLFNGDIANIKLNKWLDDGVVPCIISPNRAHNGIYLLNGETIKIDVFFPVLHGKNGEDGTIQGLFEMAGIKYVGCKVLSSACCMDKAITKTILDQNNIPNAKWIGVRNYNYNEYIEKIEQELLYPCFIKPANAGSSVGITKAHNRQELLNGFNQAFKHDSKVIVEACVIGKEIECAVLGNENPVASPLGEIAPANEFYDYDAKYNDENSKAYIPARIEEKYSDKIRDIALKAYKALDCAGLARVDFLVTKDKGEIYLNEVNTLPGFTDISMYPKLW
ncbi:MAG: D-alanine--D-alanine ligase family protein, partial [Oscillospiraceae bacterium]